VQDAGTVAVRSGAHVGRASRADVAPALEAASDRGVAKSDVPNCHLKPRDRKRPDACDTESRAMNEIGEAARPLTSVELLDVALWREIGSEEPQLPATFLDALSSIVGRWLLVRSDAPEMELVTVMCRARGYIERGGAEGGRGREWRR
jgi:hypothetical protein